MRRSRSIRSRALLGFDPARFQTKPPACYRASWQLPGPDLHRQATTSFREMTVVPAFQHTNLYLLVAGPRIRLSAKHAKIRRDGYRR